jgi:hypothetical protein
MNIMFILKEYFITISNSIKKYLINNTIITSNIFTTLVNNSINQTISNL